MMMVVGRAPEDSRGIAPRSPISVRRNIVAAGMHSHRVAVALQASLIHLLQVGEVINSDGWVGPSRSRGTTDHNGVRVLGLDGLISCGQELDVATGTQGLVAPLVMKILLVPDLVGLNLASVTLGHGSHEVGQILRTGRWPVHRQIGQRTPRPGRGFDHAEENLESRVVAAIDQSVNGAPVDISLGCLKVLPNDLVLDPAKAHVLDGADDLGVVLTDHVGLNPVTKAGWCRGRGWLRCRCGSRPR